MANYYTQFCVEIQCLTQEELDWFDDAREELDVCDMDANSERMLSEPWRDAENEGNLDFDVEFEADKLVYLSGEESDIDHPAALLQAFLKKFRPNEVLSLSWANTCSSSRPDAFGGGAVVITATEMKWMTTNDWVEETVKALAP